ncbi:MAG: division/outer membrane stress-associated lipid-binding lipoprotein [Gammaproteobacteria bacterium]
MQPVPRCIRNAVIMSGILILAQLQGCVGVIAAGGAGAAMAADRRSTGTIVDDEAIELKATNAIFAQDDLGKEAHINITCYDYVVLLTGETPTSEMRDRAVNIARHIDKVRKVYNQIVVAQPTTVKSRGKDAWITTQIKAKLLANKQVSAANVKVVTEDRTVYLLGKVSHAEAKAATEVARFVDGVGRVVVLFEYLD